MLLKIHRWVALVSSAILLVIAVTGCLLVFELPMDRWSDPGVSYVAPQDRTEPLSKTVASITGRFPAQKITEINPGVRGESTMVRTSGGLRVFIDPFTAEVIGTRTGEPPSFWIRHVHRELVGGKTGALIVNIVSVLVVFQSLSGLWLWWPLKRTAVKWNSSFTRINFDLHHAVGFFSGLFVCIIATTGVIKAYGDQLQPFFDRLTDSPSLTRAMQSTTLASGKAGIDAAVTTAQDTLPGAAIGRITPPKGKDGVWVVTMKFPGDSTAPGRSWVVVDQYSGQTLASLDSRSAPLGSRIPIVNRAIHVGGLWGVPTRLLAFLTGLSVLTQTITGLLMWLRGRAIRRAARSVDARALEAA